MKGSASSLTKKVIHTTCDSLQVAQHHHDMLLIPIQELCQFVCHFCKFFDYPLCSVVDLILMLCVGPLSPRILGYLRVPVSGQTCYIQVVIFEDLV